MAEFLITKREKCGHCIDGREKNVTFTRLCVRCGALGYIDTQVPLLDVLKKVRWNHLGDAEEKGR